MNAATAQMRPCLMSMWICASMRVIFVGVQTRRRMQIKREYSGTV
jgi:hypothetical protein